MENSATQSVKDRILIFIEEMGLKKSEFERRCNLSNGYLNQLRERPSDDKLSNIFFAFPDLNKTWLLAGEGSMLKDGAKHVPSTGEEAAPKGKTIRYWVDVDATGGGVQLFDDTLSSRHIDIQIPQFSDCTDAVNLSGDSMHPLYRGGDIIILKEWTESFIEYGNVYLIITRNGNRMVKRIQPGGDAAHITCVSENPEYKPFEVERGDILRLYIVKGSISKNVL